MDHKADSKKYEEQQGEGEGAVSTGNGKEKEQQTRKHVRRAAMPQRRRSRKEAHKGRTN